MIPHRSEGVCSHDLGRVVADQFVGSLQFARRVGCVVVDAVMYIGLGGLVREECDSFSADEITDGVMYRRELISRLEVDVVRWTISCSGLDGGVHHED